MGQQEYDNFKRLIKEWLDNHPDEYADFVEEMNDKKFKGFFKVFKIATKLAPKYKEAARKRIGDDRTPDFEGKYPFAFRPCRENSERVS